jgi:hypothetical protein
MFQVSRMDSLAGTLDGVLAVDMQPLPFRTKAIRRTASFYAGGAVDLHDAACTNRREQY